MNTPLFAPHQIAAAVHAVFPERDVTSYQLFPGRHTHANYELRLANPPEDAVLKVYLDASDPTPWKEIHLLRALTMETGVPVPRVLRFDDSCTLLPCPWALLTRLPGQSLAGVIDTLDEWELESIGYELGRYLAHIHQIPLSGFGGFLGQETSYTNERDHVIAQVTDRLSSAAARAALSPDTTDRFMRVLRESPHLNQRQACLIHGDYTPENIIVEQGATTYHVTGILEFERAQGSGPEYDIGKLLRWRTSPWPAFQKGLLDGYAESALLGAAFWDRLKLYQAIVDLECVLAGSGDQASSAARRQLAAYLASQEKN
jgi:aminoglycoside phosphotransferase (APT) family kinase protein